MKENAPLSSTRIREAVKAVRNRRPPFGPILDFYEEVFIAQEDSKSGVRIDQGKIPQDNLAAKGKKGIIPLSKVSEFVIDAGASKILCEKLLRIAAASQPDMATAAQTLTQALGREKYDLGDFFSNYLEENEQYFQQIEKELPINRSSLFFFIYQSLKPSLSVFAEMLSKYLPDGVVETGQCPVCGSPPILAMIAAEGNRFLVCSFCGHTWKAPRIYCPFCRNKESDTLRYFASSQEEEYRIDVCLQCKTYIKTVDTRVLGRIVYAPLEQISTPHLDMKAIEMGYKSGT